MNHSVPVFLVDAFSGQPFAGNPAAVCLLDRPAEAAWMQAVAREMNQSETAFLVPSGEAWGLRWFTPALEVRLCGHATLASAHVLWETARAPAGAPVLFDTVSGRLTADGTAGQITLHFPAKPAAPTRTPRGLAGALGIQPLFVGRSEYDFLLEAPSAEIVRSLRPDFTRLRQLPVRGIIVTAPSDQPEFDFVSRFFAPAAGVDEDPVTGSAHCTLGPFWSERLGRTELVGWQASPRGGRIEVRVEKDRVLLRGKALTTLRGELLCPPP